MEEDSKMLDRSGCPSVVLDFDARSLAILDRPGLRIKSVSGCNFVLFQGILTVQGQGVLYHLKLLHLNRGRKLVDIISITPWILLNIVLTECLFSRKIPECDIPY